MCSSAATERTVVLQRKFVYRPVEQVSPFPEEAIDGGRWFVSGEKAQRLMDEEGRVQGGLGRADSRRSSTYRE
jgi:hypothetical protein